MEFLGPVSLEPERDPEPEAPVVAVTLPRVSLGDPDPDESEVFVGSAEVSLGLVADVPDVRVGEDDSVVQLSAQFRVEIGRV